MKKFICLLLYILLASCSVGKNYLPVNTSSSFLLKEAKNYLRQGNIPKAIVVLEKVEKNYEDEKSSIKAQVLLTWIYYHKGDLAAAQAITETFNKFYPYNKYSAWMEYINALIDYKKISKPKLDISIAYKTLKTFKDIEQKYPNSPFAKDVKFKTMKVKQIIASKNMQIGRFYLKEKNYIGAIYRFQDIVKDYPQTIFVQEALYRLVYSFLSLGADNEALNNFKVLQYNYPKSSWTKQAKHLIDKYKIINT